MNVTVTVTTVGAGGWDEYGNPTPGQPTTAVVAGCVFDPGGGLNSDRDLTGVAVTGAPARARVFCPLTAHRFETGQTLTMKSTDPLVDAYFLDGDGRRLVWQVDGNPNVWRSPFDAWTPGVEVPLTDPKPGAV